MQSLAEIYLPNQN